MVSFLWANLAHGRERIRLVVVLLALFALLVGMIGLSPRAGSGLVITVLSVIAARAVWAGIITIRATIWSANYPRAVLAQITGRIVTVTALGVAAAAALAGIVLQTHPEWARWLYAIAALAGLAAAWFYRGMRVRQSFKLLEAEAEEGGSSQIFSLRVLREILREDAQYRRFMLWLGFYGAGNLMIGAQLVVIFSDRLHLSSVMQVGILAIVPLLCIPLFTPLWARLFDAGHVIEFRARQCWALIAAMSLVSIAVFTEFSPLLWVSAVFFGLASAGAGLGWTLGHNDFATLGKMQQYMGVNVTLTGMRGLIAPPVGVLLYSWLEKRSPGAGVYSLALPIAMALIGAVGFNRMKKGRARSGES
jgi:MFS family permease